MLFGILGAKEEPARIHVTALHSLNFEEVTLGVRTCPGWCFLCPAPEGYKKTRGKKIEPKAEMRSILFGIGVYGRMQLLCSLFQGHPYHVIVEPGGGRRWVVVSLCGTHELFLEHLFGIICLKGEINKNVFDAAHTAYVQGFLFL